VTIRCIELDAAAWHDGVQILPQIRLLFRRAITQTSRVPPRGSGFSSVVQLCMHACSLRTINHQSEGMRYDDMQVTALLLQPSSTGWWWTMWQTRHGKFTSRCVPKSRYRSRSSEKPPCIAESRGGRAHLDPACCSAPWLRLPCAQCSAYAAFFMLLSPVYHACW